MEAADLRPCQDTEALLRTWRAAKPCSDTDAPPSKVSKLPVRAPRAAAGCMMLLDRFTAALALALCRSPPTGGCPAVRHTTALPPAHIAVNSPNQWLKAAAVGGGTARADMGDITADCSNCSNSSRHQLVGSNVVQ